MTRKRSEVRVLPDPPKYATDSHTARRSGRGVCMPARQSPKDVGGTSKRHVPSAGEGSEVRILYHTPGNIKTIRSVDVFFTYLNPVQQMGKASKAQHHVLTSLDVCFRVFAAPPSPKRGHGWGTVGRRRWRSAWPRSADPVGVSQA